MPLHGADADLTHDTSGSGDVLGPPPGEIIPSSDGGAIHELPPAIELGRLRHLLREHADVVALVLFTAVAAAVRFSTLGVQSLDHDEGTTAFRVLQPTLAGTLSMVAHLERTPPLYYILAWLWTRPLGFAAGAVDLRLLSAIFGTLTVPVAYLAARELASRRAGVVTAALVALNPFLVWYSQEARAYALLILLIALGLYLFARCLRDPSSRNLGMWAVASILALSAHYFAVFTVAPEGLWLLATIRPRLRPLAAVGATAAAGLALLPLAIVQAGSGHGSWFEATSLLGRMWQVPVHFASSEKPEILSPHAGIAALQISAGVVEAVLAIVAVAILLHVGLRRERRAALLVFGLAAVSFGVPFAVAAAGHDYVDARNLAAVPVLLLVIAGIAFGAGRARRVGTAAAALACALFAAVLVAVNVTPQMQRTNWRVDAHAIGPSPVSRLAVLPRPAGPPVSYYLGARDIPVTGRPVWVREVDLLSGSPIAARPGRPFALIAEHRVWGGMWIARYESSRPTPIWLHTKRADQMIGQGASVLLTAPPGRS